MTLVEEIRNRYFDEYKTSKYRLESDFKEDEQRKTDYHGRELLELLQNVDDAAVNATLSEVDVLLEYKNNVFTVANNGTVFTQETIERLCHGSASNKSDDFIGNKGTGFRSLLNWGKQIEIHSGEFHVGFSQEFADKEFSKLLVESEIVKEQQRNVPNLSIPVLHCPFEAESIETSYDTVIRIITDESFQSDQQNILNQIKRFDYKALIFLPNITKITIRTDEFDKVVEKVNKENGKIEIHRGESVENYLFYQNPDEPYFDVGKNEKRKIRSSVAISLNEEVDYSNDSLYCFFPIRNFSTQLNCLMHATFDLNTSRDDVPLNNINKAVFEHLLTFIKTISEKELIFQNDRILPIKTLTPTDKKSKLWNENGFDLFNYYLELLKDCKVIPTVNGDFVSIADNPKLITSAFPNCFIGDEFGKLLEYMPTTDNDDLLKVLAEKNDVELEFSDEELCQRINQAARSWDTPEKVETFIWWGQEYKDSKLLPDLLKSTQESFVKANDTVYFVRGRKLDIPEWASISQLDIEFEEELKRQLQEIEKIKKDLADENILERVIARNSGNVWNSLMPQLKFRDADSSTILSPVNSSVDDYEKAKKFTKWLWDNYSSNTDWQPPEDIRFNLPSQQETVERSNHLFFDKHYGNAIGDKLFNDDKYKAFVKVSEIGIDEDSKVDLKLFVEKLGVLNFPEISTKSISDNKFKRNFTEKYLSEKLPGNDVDERSPRLVNVEFNTVDNLKEILEKMSIRDIMYWIKSDAKLRDELNLKHAGTVLFYFTARIQADRSQSYSDYMQSYIKFIFENTKWFEIDGEKFAPNQCVFAYSGLDISSVSSTITNQHIKELADELGIKQKELREFLVKIGVKEKITELQSNDFYSVLLKLPQVDHSGQISEKIYREIAELDEDPFEDSMQYQKFVNQGMVFTQNHDGKSYHLAKESYFSSSIQVNVGNYNIMRTPLRNGSFKIFNSVFGVNEFKERYHVVQESIKTHDEDALFQRNFIDFIVYARAWGEKNANIKTRIDNIRVSLVSHVMLADNGTKHSVSTNYLLIKGMKNWLIYLDSSQEMDQRQISKCIEELFAQIANTTSNEIPNQLGELYRDSEGRKFLVEKHFGSVDVINQISKNPIRTNFAEVLKLNYDSEELANIDYNQFNNINNYERFIVLLKKHDLDIDTLKERGFEYDIDIRDYWTKTIGSFIRNNLHNYKANLFGKYTEYSQSEQKNFVKDINKFKNFIPQKDNILNSVDFDVHQYMASKFPAITMINAAIDVDEVYNKNFGLLSSKIHDSNFNDFIDEHLELKSLVYFLNDEYVNYVKKQFEENLVNNTYNSVSTLITTTVDSEPTLSKGVVYPNKPKGKTNQLTQPQTRSSIERSEASKGKNGKDAEKLVRNKLKGIYDTLRWTSENSDIPAERNQSSIYDMEYQRDGKIVYVEVKAAVNNFYMSSAEYDFAHKHAESYEIYLVNLENEHIDGPHSIEEFEESKTATQYKFSYAMQ
ncbi:DUF3883 domain-containing protein [Brevibacillus centrosporus]|uniref:sacsin N-terminal ATP-binding-like domain-containing protein n=1 Tax=Brevibacillus centrosporus TaxID=54910 RepID=UPI000F0A54DE|nr:DUF3883 domain-containing protein [Brevibacillus centrosporus]MEC2130234.1 DUF3883 domain-containing protein [Brevibacillus centrosporus]RNB70950.1 DUF3883 domain-containing protein [Brevibacillus centrosporus]GED30264.1 hypothetical protein BCE02nite_14050 [Brevibacillus centrosporus]